MCSILPGDLFSVRFRNGTGPNVQRSQKGGFRRGNGGQRRRDYRWSKLHQVVEIMFVFQELLMEGPTPLVYITVSAETSHLVNTRFLYFWNDVFQGGEVGNLSDGVENSPKAKSTKFTSQGMSGVAKI